MALCKNQNVKKALLEVPYLNMKYIMCVLAVFFCFSCQMQKEKKVESVIVDINLHNSRNYTIFELIDSVRLIQLETTDESLIGFISKIYFDDNKLIVFDISQKQVLVFNEDGTFINKIHNVGQGPGEYVAMDCGLYDNINKNIIIYGGKKMLYYTLEGKLIREISRFNNNAIIRDLVNLPNGNFLCYTYDLRQKDVGKNASGLWKVDSEGNFIHSFFTIKELYPIIYNQDNSCLQLLPGNRIMIRDAQFNEIYYLDNDSLKRIITHKIRNDVLPSFKGLTFTEEKYIKSLSSQEKENYIITFWTDKVERFYTVYNKITEENILIYPSSSLWQTFNAVQPTSWNMNFIDNNKYDILITALSGEAIIDYLNTEHNISSSIHDTLKEIIEGMSESEILEMNPALQLLYVKK